MLLTSHNVHDIVPGQTSTWFNMEILLRNSDLEEYNAIINECLEILSRELILVIKEMKFKTTIRYHFTTTRMAITLKRQKIISVAKNVENYNSHVLRTGI